MDIDKYRTAYLSAVQQHCDAPVEAVGVLCRPGAVGNIATAQVSGLLALLQRRAAKKKSGGLPQNVVAAVTPTTVEVFDFQPRGGTKVKVRARVASWPRAGLHVVAEEPGPMSQRLHFTLADGTTLELDSTRGMGTYAQINDPFLAAVGA